VSGSLPAQNHRGPWGNCFLAGGRGIWHPLRGQELLGDTARIPPQNTRVFHAPIRPVGRPKAVAEAFSFPFNFLGQEMAGDPKQQGGKGRKLNSLSLFSGVVC